MGPGKGRGGCQRLQGGSLKDGFAAQCRQCHFAQFVRIALSRIDGRDNAGGYHLLHKKGLAFVVEGLAGLLIGARHEVNGLGIEVGRLEQCDNFGHCAAGSQLEPKSISREGASQIAAASKPLWGVETRQVPSTEAVSIVRSVLRSLVVAEMAAAFAADDGDVTRAGNLREPPRDDDHCGRAAARAKVTIFSFGFTIARHWTRGVRQLL